MKKIDLGQMIAVLANIGVIAGIVFLGIEINQNSNELAAQTRNSLYEMRANLELDFQRNIGGIADIYEKIKAGEALTRSEQDRFFSRRAHVLRTLEYMYEQDPQGTLEEADFWAIMFRVDPELLEMWNSTKGDRDAELVRLIEQIVIPEVAN